MYMNKAILAGFLGKDATVHNGKNGNFTILSLATQSSYKDKESNAFVNTTEWHKLIVFGPRGERAAKLKKGDHILVEGEIRHSSYESKKAKARVQTDSIVVSLLRKLDRDDKNASEEDETSDIPFAIEGEDIPVEEPAF